MAHSLGGVVGLKVAAQLGDRLAGFVGWAPRMYVRLTEDKELPPPLQDSMIANLAADNVKDIASGHLPMIGRPKELAQVLDNFVQD